MRSLNAAAAAAAAAAASGLIEEVLSVELPKPQHIRMGNWEQRPLSAEQQAYAALDAFASLLVHYKIEELPERLTLR
jgi:ribonuclease D